MPTEPVTLPEWVLTETVDVTFVDSEPAAQRGVYLVARVFSPGACTLTFEDDLVLVNGTLVDLGEDLVSVCSLIDDAFGDLEPPLGEPRRTHPFEG